MAPGKNHYEKYRIKTANKIRSLKKQMNSPTAIKSDHRSKSSFLNPYLLPVSAQSTTANIYGNKSIQNFHRARKS